MGGGTGTECRTGVAVAKKWALTVGVVFVHLILRRRRTSQADQGIEALQSRVDTLIVIPNNKLLAVISEQTPVQEAFGLPMTFCVKVAISDIITIPGLVNVDFADVRAVMADAGSALMGLGWLWQNAGREAECRYFPHLESSIQGARGVVFNITGAVILACKYSGGNNL